MKHVYFALGWLFFSLGFIGIFLPVLPTTPFMLLALWAFSRSSARFHQWLYHHRLFGPPLQQWSNHQVIPLLAKIVAITFMLISLSWLVMYSNVENWLKVTVGILMLSTAIYILAKPSVPPEKGD